VIYGTYQGFRSVSHKIASFLAAVLILIPVVVLHFVHNAGMRLLVLVIFSLAFTFCLAFFTGARASEVFAATAGFVAVQVVYIGNA
jgi:hypothetical protein